MGRILVVDDERSVRSLLQAILVNNGWKCMTASSSDEAKELLQENQFDLLLTDIAMPGESGIELLKYVSKNYPDIGLLVVSCVEDKKIIKEALEVGIYGYIVKPFENNQVRVCVDNAYRRRLLEMEHRLCCWHLEREVEKRTADLEVNVVRLSEAERKLRKANEEIKAIISAISSVLIGLNPENRIIHWNKIATETFGVEESDMLGKLLSECDISWEWQKIERGINECKKFRKSIRLEDVNFERTDGKKGILGISVNPILTEGSDKVGVLIFGSDITQRRLLEKQLAQAQKLEAIGQLAAGIAHEINTPTQYVGDNLRFLDDAFNDLLDLINAYGKMLETAKSRRVMDEEVQEIESLTDEIDLEYLLEEIPKAISQGIEGVSRVTQIVRAMKEFSHPGTKEKTPVDINHLIKNTITVARNEWKYVAEMETDFDSNLPLVRCLPGEINQVILNLIVNAVHSISERLGEGSTEKGKIKIRTRNTGTQCEIAVSDSGNGIPQEIRERIFEPFFTTKDVGKGTGQGLAIAHQVIVEKHGGSIHFESKLGKGTTFYIRIPLDD